MKNLLAGINYTIRNRDTISFESIRLESIDENIYYIPTVRDQNEGEPVKFKLISYNDKAVFENKGHDFPQRIIYSNNGSKELNVWIEGEKNGKIKKIPFTFTRVD